jgi:hypothetical protein
MQSALKKMRRSLVFVEERKIQLQFIFEEQMMRRERETNEVTHDVKCYRD